MDDTTPFLSIILATWGRPIEPSPASCNNSAIVMGTSSSFNFSIIFFALKFLSVNKKRSVSFNSFAQGSINNPSMCMWPLFGILVSTLISTPGTVAIWCFSPASINSGTPSMVSWSVKEIAVKSNSFASATSSVGLILPSEKLLCICRSIIFNLNPKLLRV